MCIVASILGLTPAYEPWLCRGIFIVPHGTSFKIICVFLGELGAQTADAAVEVALHQRLKGGKVAPLDGVDEVVVVGHHLGQPAGGQGVQHPEAAVVGVGVLQACARGTSCPWRQNHVSWSQACLPRRDGCSPAFSAWASAA